MGIVEVLLLAVGLSMDAFAVSVCKGLSMRSSSLRAGAICGAWFGGFQALMPLIGYFLGTMFAGVISSFDHWVAFGLLAVIGLNMLKEAFSGEEEETDGDLSPRTMFVMAVATSIDALAVGISLAMTGNVNIWMAIAASGGKGRQRLWLPVREAGTDCRRRNSHLPGPEDFAGALRCAVSK